MTKNRPLWEPKRRIEAAFRRRLLPLSRTRYRPGPGDLPGQDVYGESDPGGLEKGIHE